MVAALTVTMSGISLIKANEGLRLSPYRDAVGVITVCYGHTGPDVRMGQHYTVEQCNTLLLKDITTHQVVILPGNPKNCIGNRQLTANQRDAVTSFIFNIGTPKFCKSTMARLLKAGDMAGASREFPKWNKANGRVLSGLVSRREAERRLYLSQTRPEAGNVLSARAAAQMAQ
jgi:lysozyme